MSEQSIDYNAVLADLKARRDKLNEAIAVIESVANLGVGSNFISGVTHTSLAGSGPVVIRPGAFYGLTVIEATKKFLAMHRNEPKSAPQIVEALQQGGYTFTSDMPVNTVASVVSREEAKGGDVVRVGRGLFGLAEWYPGRPRKKRNGGSVGLEPILPLVPTDDENK